MWMEDTDAHINVDRAEELVATGADRIATACPFCCIMLDDGTKAAGHEEVQVADVAIHLLDAVERRDRAAADLAGD
jgi:Fe-S oxidoreductase